MNRLIIKFGDFIYRFRILICFVIFIILVMFEIHGSSLGIYNKDIQPGLNTSKFAEPIIGEAKSIRSDEYILHTPMALSQKYQDFPFFNSLWRNAPTNMALGYSAPVKDFFYLLAKPFQWGYILLGNAKGLSWYWCGRTIFLFLVTFEFFKLFMPPSSKNRILPLLGAFMVTYSPGLQWWFAINDLVEQIFWGELGVITIYYFMQSNKKVVKIFLSVLLGICWAGFITCFYPAWQIVFGYVFIILGLYVFFERYKNSGIQYDKHDLIYLLFPVLITCLIVIPIIIKSLPDIELIKNTIYPGSRFSEGKFGLYFFFFYIAKNGIFNFANICERAHFISFFPLPLILSCVYLYKDKFKDKLVMSLVFLYVFFLFFAIFGFPHNLAKYTLLYLSTGRLVMASSFIDVFLLIRILGSDFKLKTKKEIFWITIIYSICTLYGFYILRKFDMESSYWDKSIFLNSINLKDVYLILAEITIFILTYTFLKLYSNKSKHINKIYCIIMLIYFICFGFINPVYKGLNTIEGIPAGQEIKRIQAQDPGIWLVESKNEIVLSNFPILFGAATINSANIYPNFDFTKKLDSAGKYYDVYNRYAHIATIITNTVPTFFYNQENIADTYVLVLNINDLSKIGVDYILTKTEYGPEYTNLKEFSLKKIYDEGGIKIYKVNKK